MIHIGQGRTADIYNIQESQILKLYKQEFPTGAIQDEFLISRFVHSLGIRTPEPIEFTSQDNRNGILFQKVEGESLLKRIAKKPLFIKRYSMIVASLHHEIHTHSAVGLLRKQKMVLTDQIMAASLLTEDEKFRIITYLEELPDGNMLCHGDFHPDNILVGEETWIIDWMTGMAGNPSGDVARTLVLLNFGTMPEETPRLIKFFVNLLRKKVQREYLSHYLKQSKQDYIEIDRWILPVAAARLVEWIPKEEQNQLLLEIRKRLSAIT
ncbi:phosphotransferase family protein [Paenibacillus beijingensis]|uniref:Aminoglycoside phosphotransferase domain-containing protein n=1 Tax=Paenibacillus beijingensis TaxID=1126833 RepID=A0A0D5NLK2_9BACL|nr:aminoglycoside phosphotransferase family protein [Paenibacillus beijingensis]AJY76199.1 hypothetical protein VN24_18560 [Paenibacillus beijingensis]